MSNCIKISSLLFVICTLIIGSCRTSAKLINQNRQSQPTAITKEGFTIRGGHSPNCGTFKIDSMFIVGNDTLHKLITASPNSSTIFSWVNDSVRRIYNDSLKPIRLDTIRDPVDIH